MMGDPWVILELVERGAEVTLNFLCMNLFVGTLVTLGKGSGI